MRASPALVLIACAACATRAGTGSVRGPLPVAPSVEEGLLLLGYVHPDVRLAVSASCPGTAFVFDAVTDEARACWSDGSVCCSGGVCVVHEYPNGCRGDTMRLVNP